MIRWFRVVLPSSRYRGLVLAALVLVPIGVAGAFGFTYWIEPGTDLEEIPQRAMGDARGLSALSIGFVCLLYGVYRAVYFHPICRPEYAKWLANTPWTPEKALPMGPIHLVWQDLVLLVCIEVLAVFVLGLPWPAAPLLFFVPYLLALAWCLVHTGTRAHACVLFYGLVGLMFLRPIPWAIPIALGFLYLAGWAGLRRSLACFPWPGMDKPYTERNDLALLCGKSWDADLGVTGVRRRNRMLGWPYALLTSRDREPWIGHREGIIGAVFLGWSLMGLMQIIKDVEGFDALLFQMSLRVYLPMAALVRVVFFSQGNRAPVSLLGRLLTGRFIIPGYDVIFVAPLLALLAGWGVDAGLTSLGVSPTLSVPASVTAFTLLIVNLGPSMPAWQLTGAHRLQRNSFFGDKGSVKRI